MCITGAQLTQHGPAGVDQLQLAVAAEGLGVGGQTGGVPSVVTGKLAGQVGGSLGEGTQELGAVGACEERRSSSGVSCELAVAGGTVLLTSGRLSAHSMLLRRSCAAQ